MDRLKLPSDYPQMSFRISQEDKTNINAMAEEILKMSNEKLSANEKQFRKNDIIVDALYIGLLTLKRQKSGNA